MKVVKQVFKDAFLQGDHVLMQIDGTPHVVPPTLAMHHQVGMPYMDTTHVEVVEKPQVNIFSALTPLQILPTLTIIDNIQEGVAKEEDKSQENALYEQAMEEEQEQEEKKEEDQKEEENKEEEKKEEEKKEEEKREEEKKEDKQKVEE